MKKLLVCIVVLALIFGVSTQAMAKSSRMNRPDDQSINIVYKHPTGADITNPTVECRIVRYGKAGPNELGIESGDVLIWDETSADGITISGCTVSGDAGVAGVAITAMETDDNGAMETSPEGNWGVMAVRGKVLCNVWDSITAGDKLMTGAELYYKHAVKMSPDSSMINTLTDATANGAGASKWGILGTALTANSDDTDGQIYIIVQTE